MSDGLPVLECIGNVDNRRVKLVFKFSRYDDSKGFIHISSITVNGKIAYLSTAGGLINIPSVWYGPIRLDAKDVIYSIYMSDANLR